MIDWRFSLALTLGLLLYDFIKAFAKSFMTAIFEAKRRAEMKR